MDEEKYCATIPDDVVKDMMEFYGMADSEGSMERQMCENGVSWSDFA